MIKPLAVSAPNVSEAWVETFLSLMEKGGGTRHPAIVTIDGLERAEPIENAEIRGRLDAELKAFGKSQTHTVANTIFPLSLWNPDVKNDAEVLFRRYDRAWEGIRKCPANKYGVYFRRLMAYQPKGTGVAINQLDAILSSYKRGNHRKSALQLSILDPTRDQTDQKRKGFPCLQQVSFTPLENNLLSVTGFYATQYQFEKAYGNYLGLYWLGRFVAAQLGMTLTQVVCSAAVLQRGNPTVHELQALRDDMAELLKVSQEQRQDIA